MSETTIQLRSGAYFDFANPSAVELCIEDIAQGLASTCRFGGHCWPFYSVAEHSALVSYIVPPYLAMIGLMHDAAEAVLGDIPKPLKRLLPDYCRIEKEVEAALARQYGLPGFKPPLVKKADIAILRTEQMQLFVPDDKWIETKGAEAANVNIEAWTPDEGRERFLERYYELAA
ncbi:hypothetical protein [Salipiger mucosus]|uniref:Phosphohydrolase n=1 Tax=Salipiger mucosus DSM 16094 TaxID=1123237 RepID=S9Q5Y0_9RHOB|nr:hypothetical protein [Salipiger mucosus]EPX76791.1 hypothetical protein Salmuc_04677 [Salipiger mucosus DSM 16094]